MCGSTSSNSYYLLKMQLLYRVDNLEKDVSSLRDMLTTFLSRKRKRRSGYKNIFQIGQIWSDPTAHMPQLLHQHGYHIRICITLLLREQTFSSLLYQEPLMKNKILCKCTYNCNSIVKLFMIDLPSCDNCSFLSSVTMTGTLGMRWEIFKQWRRRKRWPPRIQQRPFRRQRPWLKCQSQKCHLYHLLCKLTSYLSHNISLKIFHYVVLLLIIEIFVFKGQRLWICPLMKKMQKTSQPTV